MDGNRERRKLTWLRHGASECGWVRPRQVAEVPLGGFSGLHYGSVAQRLFRRTIGGFCGGALLRGSFPQCWFALDLRK